MVSSLMISIKLYLKWEKCTIFMIFAKTKTVSQTQLSSIFDTFWTKNVNKQKKWSLLGHNTGYDVNFV